MSNLFTFCYFNLFVEPKEETFKYLLGLGLLFDLCLYSTFPFHTFLFCFFYFLNLRAKRSVHWYFFVIKGIINLSIGLFLYALFTEHLSYLSQIWPCYLVNIFLSLLIYRFRKKTIVLSHT